MTNSELDGYAHKVARYLQDENAVRDGEAVINFKTVQTICDDLAIYTRDWKRIKSRMLALGYPICYIPRFGHFLGAPGEEVANIVYKYKMGMGWVNQVHDCRQAIRRATPQQKVWIARRFKDFTVDEVKYVEVRE